MIKEQVLFYLAGWLIQKLFYVSKNILSQPSDVFSNLFVDFNVNIYEARTNY